MEKLKIKLRLRCIVYKEDDLFIASGIDLSLAAQAFSAEESIEKLKAQIKDYVQEAVSEPEYTDQLLLKRKAPISLRIKYAVMRLKYLLKAKNREEREVPVENGGIVLLTTCSG